MSKKYWQSSDPKTNVNSVSIEFSYLSPDGEMGYPGTVLFKT